MSSSSRVGDWYITINERDCGGIECREIRLTHVFNAEAELLAIELPNKIEWRAFQGGQFFKISANQIETLIKNHTRTPFATVPFMLTTGN